MPQPLTGLQHVREQLQQRAGGVGLGQERLDALIGGFGSFAIFGQAAAANDCVRDVFARRCAAA